MITKPIPKRLRHEMSMDPFYMRCCITGTLKNVPGVKIEWHHNFMFAGIRVNEKWCILPLLKEIHDDIVKHKEKCDWIMLNRADDATLIKYSKAENLIEKRNRLNKKYGVYSKIFR